MHGERLDPILLYYSLSNDRPVAAPTIAVQLFKGRDQLRSDRIQVDIADEGKKVVVFIAED